MTILIRVNVVTHNFRLSPDLPVAYGVPFVVNANSVNGAPNAIVAHGFPIYGIAIRIWLNGRIWNSAYGVPNSTHAHTAYCGPNATCHR